MKHDEEDDLQFLIFSTRRKPIPKANSVKSVVVFNDLPAGVTQTAYIYDETTIVVIDFTAFFDTLVRTTKPFLPFFTLVDNIADRAAQVIALGVTVASRNIKSFVFGKVFQQIRIARLARLRSGSGISFAGLKATRRAGRLQIKVTKKAIRLAKIAPKARKGVRLIAGVRVLAKVLRPLVILALVAEAVIIVHRVGLGGQSAGLAGATGGLLGGVFDAVTLGLAEGTGKKIEVGTTTFFQNIAQGFASLFGGDVTSISFG